MNSNKYLLVLCIGLVVWIGIGLQTFRMVDFNETHSISPDHRWPSARKTFCLVCAGLGLLAFILFLLAGGFDTYRETKRGQ